MANNLLYNKVVSTAFLKQTRSTNWKEWGSNEESPKAVTSAGLQKTVKLGSLGIETEHSFWGEW